VEDLRKHEIHNYAVTEFVQGNKTKRWAVGWSFRNMRPAQDIARGASSATLKAYLPPVTETEVARLELGESLGRTVRGIRDAIGELDLMYWMWDQQKMEGTGRAVDNVWNRAWRRKKKKREIDGNPVDLSDRQDAAFGFEVWVRVGRHDVVVGCRWLEGYDAKLFDSFQGFLTSAARSHGKLKIDKD
jgi:23S rRNA (adenine1618-N6)-methyltransferase